MASRDTTLGVQSLLSALGLKGGELPRVETSTYTPVLVMGDFSRTLSSEPLEARGLAAEILAPPAGNYAAFCLHSLGPGGSVVEHFRFNQPTAVAALTVMNFILTDVDYWGGWSQADVFDIGGRPTRSIVRQGWGAAPVIPAKLGQFASVGKTVDISSQRIYVPAGWFLSVQSAHAAVQSGIELIWRELSDPIGSA